MPHNYNVNIYTVFCKCSILYCAPGSGWKDHELTQRKGSLRVKRWSEMAISLMTYRDLYSFCARCHDENIHFGRSIPDRWNGITRYTSPFHCKCVAAAQIEARIIHSWRAFSSAMLRSMYRNPCRNANECLWKYAGCALIIFIFYLTRVDLLSRKRISKVACL